MDAWPLTLLEAARTREEHTTREDAMEQETWVVSEWEDGCTIHSRGQVIAKVFLPTCNGHRIATLPQLERDLAAARAALESVRNVIAAHLAVAGTDKVIRGTDWGFWLGQIDEALAESDQAAARAEGQG